MKKEELLSLNNAGKNVAEWITKDTKGLPYSIFQKRILEAKQGG
ncbi:MAG TPA: hypothetical protein VJ066_04175 [Candidatus Bathyarchaeia archaeon]|nr:hypothetical protein [Candidatus Bathyarchaeia archaeon]